MSSARLAMAGSTGAKTRPSKLPPLREELLLHRAPPAHDGAPAWTLEDPGRGLFFEIGWAEAEMLARWRLRTPVAIAAAVNRETVLQVDADEVSALSNFLERQSLLRLHGDQACTRYASEVNASRTRHWLSWLIHHYLFFRIPILNPDQRLERILPWLRRWLLRRPLAIATVAAALLGLLLAARQWDSFIHTFLHFFTLEGALVAALALACSKLLHEFGHAIIAKHHGCRVASMGVAFMVLWPVLYTDTSGAWRLPRRRQRISIAAAGMLSEAALAAWATLAWSFLPDGMLRSAAFMLATTTWLLTLAINLNPFARFDGYFLLADALNVPNLQPRSFALARWQLREWLFGFGEDAPENFTGWRHRALLAYAFSCWLYRLLLFLGIALLVYHFAFKLLGLLLFAIEIVFFVIAPIFSELKAWRQRLHSGARSHRRTRISAALLLTLLLLAALPWHRQIQAPALARAAEQIHLLAPVGGRIEQLTAAPGQAVAANTPVYILRSPELEHERQALQLRIDLLNWQLQFHSLRLSTASGLTLAQSELQMARKRMTELQRQQAQLRLSSPFAGVLVESAEPLAVGDWVAAGEWLGTVAAPQQTLIEAYVGESEVQRIQRGDRARFLPDDPGQPARPLRVVAVSATATTRLGAVPELASANGGALAAARAPRTARSEQGQSGEQWIPEQAIYRIVLEPAPGTPAGLTRSQVVRGTALIDGQAESLLLRSWRWVTAVVVRESGF